MRTQPLQWMILFAVAALVLAACGRAPAAPPDPTVLLQGTPEAGIVQPTFAQDSITDQAVAKFKQMLAENPNLPVEPDPKGGGKAPASLDEGRMVGKDLVVAVTQPGADPFFERPAVLTDTTTPPPPQIPFLEEDLADPQSVQSLAASGPLKKITPIGKLSQRVKLFMNFTKPATRSQCSGTVVDSQWILTAAHCVYRFEGEGDPNNGYATLVEVVPGFNGSSEPFGRAFGKQILVYPGWRDHGDTDHDIAFVRVTRPIGGVTGFPFKLPADCDFLTSSVNPEFQTSGYPAETKAQHGNPDLPSFDGKQMFHRSFRFDKCEGFQARLDEPSIGGMSGSGALLDNSVWAVLATSDRKSSSHYVRLTKGKANTASAEINGTSPSSPDLVALMATAQRDIAPPRIRIPQSLGAEPNLSVQRSRTGAVACFTQGQRVRVTFRAHNFSNVLFSGKLRYTVYLSSDDLITASDTALSSFSLEDVFADYKQTRFVSNVVNLPSFTPTGKRFIGVILTNSDFDTSNNDSSDDDAGELEIRSSCP